MNSVFSQYDNASCEGKYVIKNLSITILKGKKVGLIGLSGAGKSTVVGMLIGLFAPAAGMVTDDGTKLTDSLRAGWMEHIGYVPQSTFLLNATIAQNVAFPSGEKI